MTAGWRRDRGSGDIGPPAARVDTRGSYCPVPIVKTADAVKKLAPGECVEVISDDPGFEADLPLWCRSTGNELVAMETAGREIRAVIRRLPVPAP